MRGAADNIHWFRSILCTLYLMSKFCIRCYRVHTGLHLSNSHWLCRMIHMMCKPSAGGSSHSRYSMRRKQLTKCKFSIRYCMQNRICHLWNTHSLHCMCRIEFTAGSTYNCLESIQSRSLSYRCGSCQSSHRKYLLLQIND